MGKNDPVDSSTASGLPPAVNGGGFWQKKTIEELAAEQGVPLVPNLDALLGAGEDLWADDAEFEAFLGYLEAIRREQG